MGRMEKISTHFSSMQSIRKTNDIFGKLSTETRILAQIEDLHPDMAKEDGPNVQKVANSTEETGFHDFGCMTETSTKIPPVHSIHDMNQICSNFSTEMRNLTPT